MLIIRVTIFILFFALVGAFSLSLPVKSAWAQTAGEPLEITADGSLEWHRQDRKFIARKNAVAKQGEAVIHAQKLEADYQETSKSKTDITHMTAIGTVKIVSDNNVVYGDKAIYDLVKGEALVTGDNLKMVSPDQVLTARDYFEYNVQKGEVYARGEAVLVTTNEQGQTNTLHSDTIKATLVTDENGKRVLQTLEALDNVVITTPTETITGAYGIYNAQTQKADLNGNVKIKRGPNILEGDRAEVDLKTDTSRLFGKSSGKTRVRGVFYPGSEKREQD